MTGGVFAGDVVRYQPESTWCHDGYAVAEKRPDGSVVLVDTYWTYVGMSHGTVVSPAAFDFVCNLGDYDEKPEHEWEKYAEADRVWIPRHACYRPLRLVRKGAQPDLATQIENARERVREAERKVESAQSGLAWRREELAALEAQAVAS